MTIIHDLRKEVHRLRREKKDLFDTIGAHLTRRGELQEKVTGLENLHKGLDTEYRALRNNLQSLIAERDDAKNLLSTSHRINLWLSARIMELRKEINALRGKI